MVKLDIAVKDGKIAKIDKKIDDEAKENVEQQQISVHQGQLFFI